MKTTKNYCVNILLIIFTFISCEKDNTIEKEQNFLIPLEVGNEWTYQTTKKYTTPNEIDTITQIVVSKTEINGFEGFMFETGERPYNSHFLCNNNLEGDFVNIGGYSDVDTLLVNSINFKYDVQKGDSWNYNSAIYNYEDGTFEERIIEVKCIAHDTLIIIARDEYKCKLYEDSPNFGDDIFRYFISDNIGINKLEHYELGKLQLCRELIDYNLY